MRKFVSFFFLLAFLSVPVFSSTTVDLDEAVYKEHALDITGNSGSDNEIISLDDLDFFASQSNLLTLFNPWDNSFSDSANQIYSFGDSNLIKSNALLSPGRGYSDMNGLIPGFESYDKDTYYIYVYSQFGAQGKSLENPNEFQEWVVGTGAAIIPAPSAILLAALGIGLIKSLRKLRML